MDYIKHWKMYSSIYTILSISLYFIFAEVYRTIFSVSNIILLAVAISLCIVFYALQAASPTAKEMMSRYDYNYLLVKFAEVFLQQLIIIAIFFFTHQNLLLFSFIFCLLHLHLFFYKPVFSALAIILAAFVLSLIFYYLYISFGLNGLGISYLFHMGIYMVGGKVFKYIY